ncbi:MAG TPA: hypothetical protein VF576_14085 [Rubricoccaceae bacterium]|jgi:hypothetical protein
MRLALLAALALVGGCDAPTDSAGTFDATLSGARAGRLSGPAEFDQLPPCRSLFFRSGEVRLSLVTGCADPDDRDAFRAGTLRVTPTATDSTVRVGYYDAADRRAYRGTGGTVEVTSESDERVTGRLDIEARRLRLDNQVDTTGTPLRIVGSFDARGFVGLY